MAQCTCIVLSIHYFGSTARTGDLLTGTYRQVCSAVVTVRILGKKADALVQLQSEVERSDQRSSAVQGLFSFPTHELIPRRLELGYNISRSNPRSVTGSIGLCRSSMKPHSIEVKNE